jgi:hypothetical protein
LTGTSIWVPTEVISAFYCLLAWHARALVKVEHFRADAASSSGSQLALTGTSIWVPGIIHGTNLFPADTFTFSGIPLLASWTLLSRARLNNAFTALFVKDRSWWAWSFELLEFALTLACFHVP